MKGLNKMKIGIEVQRLFRKRKFGIESSSLELIKKLRELGPDHEYVIFAKKDEDFECLTPSDNLKIRTVAGKLFVDFEQFFLPLAAGKEHVDILHCTGNTAPYFSPVPVVQTLHDVIFMDAIPAGDSPYQRFGNHYRRRVVPLVTPRSKAIITVSEYEKSRIVERLGISPDRIQVIYNGINEKRFHAHYDQRTKAAVREKYGLPQNFILFIGNQSFRKNSGRAIEAYVRYASTTVQPIPLVTPGLPEKVVAEKLKELKFPYTREQFITPGYISDTDLPVLYGLSTIFLFPSLSEGFGMPIVEAMACGAPVITSGISCMPEIAGNAGILADPYDTEDLAQALVILSTNEALRRDKIAAGIENARRFSWDQAARKILSIYETVYSDARKEQKVPGFFYKHVFATRH
jgi:glycosyltransferase involved in cell wall biosynthesis